MVTIKNDRREVFVSGGNIEQNEIEFYNGRTAQIEIAEDRISKMSIDKMDATGGIDEIHQAIENANNGIFKFGSF